MASADQPPGAGRRRRAAARYAGLAASAVALAALLWLAVSAALARHQAQAGEQAAGRLRTALLQGDLPAARTAAAAATGHARAAHRLTTGPAWWVSARIPWLGRPARSIRGCTAEADRLGSGMLPALLGLADTLTPSSLLDAGTVRLQPITDAAPVLRRADEQLQAAIAQLDRLPADTWLSPVDRSRAELRTSLTQLADQLHPASQAAEVLPDLLGRSGPRRYFVGLENEAESRGIGGIPGAFVIVTADSGRLSFDRFDSDTALDRVRTPPALARDLGSEYAARYRGAEPTRVFANSTISPDFSEAARIWAGMWQASTGQRIDGALAIDPTAISYLLQVTGPARLADGHRLTGDEVVALTQQTLYRSHPDKAARKAYLLEIARAISARLLSAHGSPELLGAAARAAGEHRILLWSADPAVQRQLAGSPVAGLLPTGPGYVAGFGTVNATGGKLDYYLTRSMTYTRQGCSAGSTSTSTFTLANEAPAGPLPGYVTLRLDSPGYRTRPGDDKVLLSYYGTPGSKVTAVTLDGRPMVVMPESEHGLTVVSLPVELARGTRHSVTVTAVEPARAHSTEILRQPAVHPVSVTSALPGCDAGAPGDR